MLRRSHDSSFCHCRFHRSDTRPASEAAWLYACNANKLATSHTCTGLGYCVKYQPSCAERSSLHDDLVLVGPRHSEHNVCSVNTTCIPDRILQVASTNALSTLYLLLLQLPGGCQARHLPSTGALHGGVMSRLYAAPCTFHGAPHGA